uniref:Ubiquitin-fold modifier-conjugating enzyme 1 n=1 Tax=Electrophorus electricus TaxID=8005 RepID=A0AAY5ER89_ELEEL
MVDEATRKIVSEIPLRKTHSGPKDKESWKADNDWFCLESNREGTRWFGKCWYIHELLKYEFDMELDSRPLYSASNCHVTNWDCCVWKKMHRQQ